MVYSVILAGGSSSRMKGPVNKTLIRLCGKSVIRRSVEAFSALSDQMVVVCHPDVRQDLIREVDESSVLCPVRYVNGGASRQQSVLNGLLSLDFREDDLVLVHDAARCLVSREIIMNVINSVRAFGSGSNTESRRIWVEDRYSAMKGLLMA